MIYFSLSCECFYDPLTYVSDSYIVCAKMCAIKAVLHAFIITVFTDLDYIVFYYIGCGGLHSIIARFLFMSGRLIKSFICILYYPYRELSFAGLHVVLCNLFLSNFFFFFKSEIKIVVKYFTTFVGLEELHDVAGRRQC